MFSLINKVFIIKLEFMMKVMYLYFFFYYNVLLKVMFFGRCCIVVGIFLYNGYSLIIFLLYFLL